MKIYRSILLAVLGLGVAGAAQAGTVYLTGSTAFRSQTFDALSTAGAVFSAAPTITTWEGAAPAKANYMAFTGTVIGGGSTTVLCHWSGSEAGFGDTASVPQPTEQFAAVQDGANHTGSPTSFVSHTADLSMAGNIQDYSGVFANNLTPPPPYSTGQEVGVVTFEYVRNPGLWTGTNITHAMIRQALGGFCVRSVFTGVPGQGDFVYVSGRDSGSGTRVNTFDESGFGAFTPPNQIEINGTTGAMIDNNPPNGAYAKGDYGFSSGGTLAGTMGASTTASADLANGGTGFSVVAYMSTSDAATALSKGAFGVFL